MKNKHLQKIANTLILNQHNINSIGLLDGKLGLAIYMYHYSRSTQNNRYKDYAEQILDSVIDHVEKRNFKDGFKDGICGIGWGIDYLNKNLFIEGDINEILEDIDSNILSNIDVDKQIQLLLDSSLFDLGLYFSMRINNIHYKKENKIAENILTVIKAILNTNFSFNMAMLNSILYTINQINNIFKMSSIELIYLTNIVNENIERLTNEDNYNNTDLLILKELNPTLALICEGFSVQPSNSKIDVCVGGIWQQLLYNIEKPICHFESFQIDEEIDKLTMSLLLEDLTMEKGLTGLGISLILNER